MPIKSDFRVHEITFDWIKDEVGQNESLKVLDIATGTGAFAQRIVDNFPGWELEVNDFMDEVLVEGLNKNRVDLNCKFGDKFSETGYDLVVALEVLEHIENPWNFLRETRKLLGPNGILILSTPNTDSLLDRLYYLLYGYPFYFGEPNYVESYGHITPVPDWLFKKMAKESGYSQVKRNDSIDTSVHMSPAMFIRRLLVMPCSSLYMQNFNNRSINVYLCR